MSSHAVAEFVLAVAVFLGVIYRVRGAGLGGYRKYAKDFLIGMLLILNAVSTSFLQGSSWLTSEMEMGLMITLFLPLACSLRESGNGKRPVWRNSGIWLSSGLGILAFHALTNYEIVLYGVDLSVSGMTIVAYLALGAIVFRGHQRVLLIVSASTWILHFMVDSAAPVSGLVLIMGGLVFFRSGLVGGGRRFREIGFEPDDLIEAYLLPFLVLDLSGKVVFANDEFLRISGYGAADLSNREALNFFEFPDVRRLDAFKQEGSKRIRCLLKRSDGDKRPVQLALSEIFSKGGKLRNLLCVISDEKEHEQMQARIRAEARRFSSLYDTSRALSTSLEIRDVLETIATTAESLTDSDSCTIFTLDSSNQIIRPTFSTEKEFREEVMEFEFPVGKGLTGLVVQDGKPRIENWDDGSRGAVLIPGTSEEDTESLLSVPLLARNEVIGALTLYKLNRKRFNDEQISTLTVFASQASIAIETSRLYMRLKESERIYKSSMNMAADSVFFVDTETGKINDVNETGLKTFGYRRSELASMHIWELCSRSHMQYSRRLWQKAVSDGQGSLSETVFETRDELVIPVSVNASRIEAGDVRFVQWVVRDISEYKNLMGDMKFFRNLVSDLGEPILVTEPLGVVVYFNAAFEKLFSMKLRKAEGSTINALSIGNKNLALLDSMRSRLKENELRSEEVEFRARSGEAIRRVVSIILSYDKDSNVKHYVWLFSPAVGRRKDETSRVV